jgi:hypothetical protein
MITARDIQEREEKRDWLMFRGLNYPNFLQEAKMLGVEMGRTLLELQKRFSSKYPNQRAMARKLGISTARINQYIKLVTDLDPEVQDLVAPADQRGNIPEGAITDRIAYEISHIPDKEWQREVQFCLVRLR